MAQLGYVLYHAIRAAPSGKLEAIEFENFVPKWWEDKVEAEPDDADDAARKKLADKIASMFQGIQQ